MIKFHNLVLRKLTSKELLQQLKNDVQATIEMHKRMNNGTWQHKSEVDGL